MIQKTPADIVRALKGFYDTQITSLNGMMDKVPDSIKTEFKKLHDALNAQLAQLGPLEQVPAASEAASAMEYFARCISNMQEYATSMMTRLQDMQRALSDKQTAYQSLEDRTKNGELLTKEAAKALADTAREEGVQSVMPNVISLRKSQVELAGLPEAPEGVLSLPADKYDPALAAAKENVKKLNEKGFKIGGRGAGLIKEMAWLGAAEFAGRMTNFADVIGTPARSTTTPDPLLGNGGGTGGGAGAKTERDIPMAVI